MNFPQPVIDFPLPYFSSATDTADNQDAIGRKIFDLLCTRCRPVLGFAGVKPIARIHRDGGNFHIFLRTEMDGLTANELRTAAIIVLRDNGNQKLASLTYVPTSGDRAKAAFASKRFRAAIDPHPPVEED